MYEREINTAGERVVKGRTPGTTIYAETIGEKRFQAESIVGK